METFHMAPFQTNSFIHVHREGRPAPHVAQLDLTPNNIIMPYRLRDAHGEHATGAIKSEVLKWSPNRVQVWTPSLFAIVTGHESAISAVREWPPKADEKVLPTPAAISLTQ
jgi:hypothetical protein